MITKEEILIASKDWAIFYEHDIEKAEDYGMVYLETRGQEATYDGLDIYLFNKFE